MKLKKTHLILFALTMLGGLLRLYKLDWSHVFFFHPDERNIASAVLDLDPAAGDFNPNFFAYGSLPIYVTYAIGALLTFLTKTNWLEFGKVILIGRAISATLSTLLIPLVYLVFQQLTINNQQLSNAEEKSSNLWGILAALITTFTVGFIQYAHFSTFEIILTFEYLLALYFALRIAKEGRWRDYLLGAFVIGTSIATKVTSLLILPIFPLVHFVRWFGQLQQNSHDRSNFVTKIWLKIKQNFLQFSHDRNKIVTAFLLTILTAIIFSPYNILDFSSFRGAMDYEGGVATGSLPVFYTVQFIDTIPVWFQLTRVFPYILGWPLTVVGFLAFFYFLISHLGHLRDSRILLFLSIPTLYFVFHAALFVKWTRYMIPMLPFLIIMAVWLLKFLGNDVVQKTKVFVQILVFAVVLWTIVQGLSFFSIYLRPDTRVAAAKWARQNIPGDAQILSEVWDMGLIAFNPHFEDIKLFNFYELDTRINTDDSRISTDGNPKVDELVELLEESEYIIVPSQRIYATRLRLPKHFPIGARYYQSLFDGTLGFSKIAEFDSSFYLLSEAKAEETFKVFDHPKVVIFEKVKPMTQTQYSELLLQ